MLSGVGTKLQYGSCSVRSPIHTPPRFSSDTSACAGRRVHPLLRQAGCSDSMCGGHTLAASPSANAVLSRMLKLAFERGVLHCVERERLLVIVVPVPLQPRMRNCTGLGGGRAQQCAMSGAAIRARHASMRCRHWGAQADLGAPAWHPHRGAAAWGTCRAFPDCILRCSDVWRSRGIPHSA